MSTTYTHTPYPHYPASLLPYIPILHQLSPHTGTLINLSPPPPVLLHGVHVVSIGMFLFALSLCASAWVLYWNHPYGVLASSLVTVICVSGIVFWYLRVYLKWAKALEKVQRTLCMWCPIIFIGLVCAHTG